jgi:hypothetical protein
MIGDPCVTTPDMGADSVTTPADGTPEIVTTHGRVGGRKH